MTELATSGTPSMPVPVTAAVPNPVPATAAPTTAAASVKPLRIQDAKIMILDDEPHNVMVVRKYLRDEGYSNVITSTDPADTLRCLPREAPSLLILDIMMPKISGMEVLRLLRADQVTSHLPVLVLTASTDATTKRAALDLGATDFLTKPLDPNDLIPRVRNALMAREYHDRLANHAENLAREVRLRTAELAASRREVVHCLARAAEYRDDITGNHVRRVGRFAKIIGRKLGMSEAETDDLELATQLHDVGKIGVPDEILHKPGKLDPEQYALIQKHCAIGKRILMPFTDEEARLMQKHAELGANLLAVSSSPLLMLATRIAQSHHEWWDGSGYPLGLAGNDIPLEGRIAAAADVYDALSSQRPYKPALPRYRCFAMLESLRGKQFDPRVLDAFFARADEIVQAQIDLMDPP